MNILAELLSSRARAEVLRLLLGISDEELHVREIERRSGLALGTIRQELAKLTRLDLVCPRRSGNRLYYHANLANPLSHDLRNLVLKTSGLSDVLRQKLGDEGIAVAFVFGSVARGTVQSGSDVDLMVVGSVGFRELSHRLAGVTEVLGREVNPHVLTPAELVARLKDRDHFICSIMQEPKVFVIGAARDLEELAR